MSAEENFKAMKDEYGLLLNADVSQKILQTIVRRILGREIQREEAMRDLLKSGGQDGNTTKEKQHGK